MSRRWLPLIAALAIAVAPPIALRAQSVATGLAGEWTGTLQLDNSSPRVAFEFSLAADSTLTGRVFADGDPMGPMEQLAVRGDTVHFMVGRFDFTGVVSGPRMRVALIVYNGTTRDLTMVKTPPLAPASRPNRGG